MAMLAFVVSTFVYFSFANIYSSKILNFQEFEQQFSSGIYQYRKLSGWLLIGVYEVFQSFNLDPEIFKLKFLDPKSEPLFYLSFYLLNTFFLMLSAVMLTLISESKSFDATETEKTLINGLIIFTISLSQFVIVPYDVSSYFFLILFFYILLKFLNLQNTQNLVSLCLILALSTLNRETAALSVSLAATLLYAKNGLRQETKVPVLILAGVFVAGYFGLRMFGEDFTTNDGNLLIQNFTQPKNLLGLVFWITFLVFSLLIAKNTGCARRILMFHVLSAPYILICIYSGILYEIRLYVPLFITSVLIGRTKLSQISLNKTIFG